MSDNEGRSLRTQRTHTTATRKDRIGKNGWFKGNDDDAYLVFEQFMNGQDFYVH